MFGPSMLFWWGLIYGRYGRAGYGADVFYVFTTAVQTGMLGAVLALASSPFYNEYVQRFGGDVEVALADQQVAGLVMWIPAGIPLTLVALRCLPPGSVKPSGRHAYGRTLP